MCKWKRVITRHKGNPCYWIAQGWKNEFGSFNLETLKFLMHFRESGSSLLFYFYHTYSYIFFFSHTYIFFFFFILIFYSFFLSLLFLFAHLELKLHCTYPSPMLRRLLVLGQRGDRDKVGTRNIFPLER
jgi:hypothetical protein